MTRDEMQAFVEASIPLVQKAGFVIQEMSDREIVVSGDQGLNHNHHNSVFGGSISTILILTSWLMARQLLENLHPEVSIVIERHSTDYLIPVHGPFFARCFRPAEGEIESLRRILEKKGRGRLDLAAFLFQDGDNRAAARFTGTFYCRQNSRLQKLP